jgi:hypothetical protein
LLERLASRLMRFLALDSADRYILLVSSFLLPVFWLGLRLFGLARFHALVTRSPARPGYLAPGEIRTLAQLVNVAARYSPFAATCLTRSLLLEWMLRRRGVDSQLRIGVRLTRGSLDAHAWVECDGVPVNDKPDVASHFAPFGDSVPAAAFNTRAGGAP